MIGLRIPLHSLTYTREAEPKAFKFFTSSFFHALRQAENNNLFKQELKWEINKQGATFRFSIHDFFFIVLTDELDIQKN